MIWPHIAPTHTRLPTERIRLWCRGTTPTRSLCSSYQVVRPFSCHPIRQKPVQANPKAASAPTSRSPPDEDPITRIGNRSRTKAATSACLAPLGMARTLRRQVHRSRHSVPQVLPRQSTRCREHPPQLPSTPLWGLRPQVIYHHPTAYKG